jgi:MFS family permease
VAGETKPKVTEILSNPRLRPVTLLLAFGYMFHTITFYYILKWAVKIVADYPPGYAQPEAASVLTYANIGGALGGLLFGFLMKRWHIKGPTVAMMILGVAAVTAFGAGYDSLWGWRCGGDHGDVLHQRRDCRLLCGLRTRLSCACPGDGCGFCAGCRAAGGGRIAHHCRLSCSRRSAMTS